MKYLIIILLFFSLNVSAQKWQIPALYAGSIILEGIGDGLYDNGTKQLGKSFQAVSLSLILLSPFIADYNKDKWWAYPISYGFLRVGLFDWTYNTARGLPLTYIGNTTYWDKGMQKLNPPNGFAMGRAVFFTVGFSIPFKL